MIHVEVIAEPGIRIGADGSPGRREAAGFIDLPVSPFMTMENLAVVVILFFPEVATWLPRLLFD